MHWHTARQEQLPVSRSSTGLLYVTVVSYRRVALCRIHVKTELPEFIATTGVITRVAVVTLNHDDVTNSITSLGV